MRSLFRALQTLAAALALGSVAACTSLSPASADTVYLNGKIITADKSFSIAQVLAVKDGRFG